MSQNSTVLTHHRVYLSLDDTSRADSRGPSYLSHLFPRPAYLVTSSPFALQLPPDMIGPCYVANVFHLQCYQSLWMCADDSEPIAPPILKEQDRQMLRVDGLFGVRELLQGVVLT